MTSSAIPTLGAALMLTSPPDMMAYVLRYYATAPFQGNNENITQAISLANTLSKYSYDSSMVTNPIQSELTDEFNRVFPQATSLSVDVSVTTVTSSLYTISISPTVTIGENTYSVSRTISTSNGVITMLNDTVDLSTVQG